MIFRWLRADSHPVPATRVVAFDEHRGKPARDDQAD